MYINRINILPSMLQFPFSINEIKVILQFNGIEVHYEKVEIWEEFENVLSANAKALASEGDGAD